ncbi:MAG: IspD/TarI family cytidylyltransferase [Bacillota bacterium]
MNIGVVFAGGVGSRMNSKEVPKQFLEMYNKPIIIHTLDHFEKNDDIDTVVVVCVEEWIPYLEELLYKFRIEKVKKIVTGGTTGQLSIYNGLCAAEEISGGKESIVLIHDGVRPLINTDILSKNIESVEKYGSAITTGIVKETIIVINNNREIDQVPNREHSRVAKAPQSFWLDEVLSVQRKALAEGKSLFIDTCSLMQYYGKKMYTIDGPEENMKITTPADFYIMRAILEAKENAQIYGMK